MSLLRLSLVTCLVLGSFSVVSAEKWQPTPAEQKKLNTFFSNFAEAFVEPFREGQISDQALIDFGLLHNKINRYKKCKTIQKGGTSFLRIPVAFVNQAAEKYFGKVPRKHSSSGDFYDLEESDGEAYRFAQVTSIETAGTDLYQANVTVFTCSSGDIPDPQGSPESWGKVGAEVEVVGKYVAKIRKAGGTFKLLEYLATGGNAVTGDDAGAKHGEVGKAPELPPVMPDQETHGTTILKAYLVRVQERNFLEKAFEKESLSGKACYQIVHTKMDPIAGEVPDHTRNCLLYTDTQYSSEGLISVRVRKLDSVEMKLDQESGGFTQLWDVYLEVEK